MLENRPVTTLFMLMSVDGKISGGEGDMLDVDRDWCTIIMQNKLDLPGLLETLKAKYNVERLTIQSGGSMNCEFLRCKLFDYVDIVVAPILVGGKNTPTLIDGEAISVQSRLDKLGVLRLKDCKVLENSYIRLTYQVIS